jgi:hypothetical protein
VISGECFITSRKAVGAVATCFSVTDLDCLEVDMSHQLLLCSGVEWSRNVHKLLCQATRGRHMQRGSEQKR